MDFIRGKKSECSAMTCLVNSLRTGAECDERLQQKAHHRAGDDIGGLDLEEWREG